MFLYLSDGGQHFLKWVQFCSSSDWLQCRPSESVWYRCEVKDLCLGSLLCGFFGVLNSLKDDGRSSWITSDYRIRESQLVWITHKSAAKTLKYSELALTKERMKINETDANWEKEMETVHLPNEIPAWIMTGRNIKSLSYSRRPRRSMWFSDLRRCFSNHLKLFSLQKYFSRS